MTDKDTLQDNVEDLVTHVTEYLDTQRKLLTINVVEKSAAAASATVSIVVLLLLGTVGLLFLNIALALFLGKVFGDMMLGFLAVGGFYLLCGLVFFANRKAWVEDKIAGRIINKYFEDNEN
ncbi:MAG: phage holin family protein [Saprospiraceae bacterium]